MKSYKTSSTCRLKWILRARIRRRLFRCHSRYKQHNITRAKRRQTKCSIIGYRDRLARLLFQMDRALKVQTLECNTHPTLEIGWTQERTSVWPRMRIMAFRIFRTSKTNKYKKFNRNSPDRIFSRWTRKLPSMAKWLQLIQIWHR